MGTGSRRTCATWMFSFPNSFAKLWLSARRPCLPAANALVVTLPRTAAVAPVKMSVPRLPSSFRSLDLKARMASRENPKAAVMFVSTVSLIYVFIVSQSS